MPRSLPSRPLRITSQHARIAAQSVACNKTAGRAPSPLNGERAGVRGEMARGAPPSQSFENGSSSLFLLASFSVFSAARNKTAGRAPSPLNGSGAGVRGEMAHCSPLGNSSSKHERTPEHNARGEQQSQQLKAENNQDAALPGTDPIVIRLCVQEITADLHRR